MEARGVWENRKVFTITDEVSGYEVQTSPKDDALNDILARPMEMILNGIIGCMGATICTIMRHHMDKVNEFEITAVGQRAETEPKYFTHFDIYIYMTGEIRDKEIKRATKLAEEKYCSAINSVKASRSYYINLNHEDI